jgi:hypothetical protein
MLRTTVLDYKCVKLCLHASLHSLQSVETNWSHFFLRKLSTFFSLQFLFKF